MSARAAALVASALAFAAPLAAEACPVCAGRTVDHPIAQGLILGSFIFFPYLVVYAVVRFIRSGLRREQPSMDGDR